MTINKALQTGVLENLLTYIDHIVELGPGCETSLSYKTLPVLKAAPDAKTYIAIDATDDVANSAAMMMAEDSHVTGQGHSMDFFHEPFVKTWSGNAVILFWGSTLGNFDGFAGDDPFHRLVGFLHNIRKGLELGDHILFSFDSQDNEGDIIRAYSEDMMSTQLLSIIHQISPYVDGGQFNPWAWKHRPMWIAETMQCAHVLYSIIDQEFSINGNNFTVKAFDPYISNNSYKYTADKMRAAALMAGFENPTIIQDGPMALLSAAC